MGGHKHHLLKAYAKYSPIDRIAGNPNSLMAQMAQADYLIGRLTPEKRLRLLLGSAKPSASISSRIKNGKSFFTRIRYNSCHTPPPLFLLSPFGLGVDYRCSPHLFSKRRSFLYFRIIRIRASHSHQPRMVPHAHFAIRLWGSLDLCTAGGFIAAGLTSAYQYKISDYVLCMTNYAGYYSTTNLWMSGVNFNYNLHNWIFKNGLSLTLCDAFTFYSCLEP